MTRYPRLIDRALLSTVVSPDRPATPVIDIESAAIVAGQLKAIIGQHRLMFAVAPYVGISLRIAVLVDGTTMINPTIVGADEALSPTQETCPLYPGIAVERSRPTWIRVRYVSEDGETTTRRLEGRAAALVCQAIDVLDSKTLLDGLSSLKKEKLLRKSASAARRIRAS